MSLGKESFMVISVYLAWSDTAGWLLTSFFLGAPVSWIVRFSAIVNQSCLSQ